MKERQKAGDMRKSSIFACIACALAPAAVHAGPISKWDSRPPKERYWTSVSIYDVERCMVDMDNVPPPVVVRQPDRPDRTTMLWGNPVTPETSARLDAVHREGSVEVTVWRLDDGAIGRLKNCAPPR